ncbi:thioredoxin family protein [Fibrella aquatica]|uniref:thioredoxin family protein n=1 Tax=Fibrella aquatica TaxID=3242487 RepID=UPI0035207A37
MILTVRFLLVLCLLPGLTVAQINFQKKAWKDVLAEAKIQRKLIFVDVYTDWCGPCKMLDREVFRNSEVGKRFNGQFINYKADAEHGGIAIASQYNVRAYPTGLFINGDGELVHTFVGYRPVEFFLKEGEQAFLRTNDGIDLAFYMQSYEEGNRTPELMRAILKLNRKYGRDREAIVEDYLTKLPADSLNKLVNLMIAYENAERVDSKAFSVLVANKKDVRFLDRARIILSQDINRSAENRREDRLPVLMTAVEQLVDERVDEQKADYQIQFYESMKQWDQYAVQAEAYVKTHLAPSLTLEAKTRDSTTFWMNYYKLCNIGWSFFKEVKDEAKLKAMTDYVRQANQLTETPNAMGVCACLLYQMGQKEQAVQWQEKAVLLSAQTGASDVDAYKDRLKRMQKGKPVQ